VKALHYRRAGRVEDMTRRTALLIAGSEDLTVTAYGPVEGKFGAYIERMSETLAGSPRVQLLITSEPTYATSEAAVAAAAGIVEFARDYAAREFTARDNMSG
jgi:hypothetical protein